MRIVEAQLHLVHIHLCPINEVPREAAVADQYVITKPYPSVLRLAVVQLRIAERSIVTVQMSVGEVTHILDDHRVMRLPRKIKRHTGPSVLTLQLGKLRHGRCVGETWISGKNPDQTIADAHGI